MFLLGNHFAVYPIFHVVISVLQREITCVQQKLTFRAFQTCQGMRNIISTVLTLAQIAFLKGTVVLY